MPLDVCTFTVCFLKKERNYVTVSKCYVITLHSFKLFFVFVFWRNLLPVTQLYVSVDASTRESLKKIDRPLFRDFWSRFLESLRALADKVRFGVLSGDEDYLVHTDLKCLSV